MICMKRQKWAVLPLKNNETIYETGESKDTELLGGGDVRLSDLLEAVGLTGEVDITAEGDHYFTAQRKKDEPSDEPENTDDDKPESGPDSTSS